jgi:type II secretory pathway pseudopilin PulG
MRVGKLIRAGGFTYLSLLFGIALLGVGLSVTGVVWTTEVRRSQKIELAFIGAQFQRAIASYYESSPGNVKKYPANLQQLLEDDRFLFTRRHLRKLYVDPLTRTTQWGLVIAPDGGVMGVYSLKQAETKFTYIPIFQHVRDSQQRQP